MTQLDILRPEPDPLTVAPGDIFALGRHRLMCGDATDKAQVAMLFAGQRPTLVVTSPPYAKQRDYDRPIACWDSMMLGALDAHDFADDVQLFINLGDVHIKGEWTPYWYSWTQEMRNLGWRHFGMYVWDKLLAIPGQNQGRCRTAHEHIVHLNKKATLLNEIVPNKLAGKMNHGQNSCDANGIRRQKGGGLRPIKPMRIQDSVFRMYGERHNKTGHPAVYPLHLPRRLISSWRKPECITYDPFLGSGTTLLACEAENVTGLGMEISPAYCTIAIDRWNKAHPDQPARRSA